MGKKNKNLQKKISQNCIEFYVEGMHCPACEILVEKKLAKYDGVEKIDATLTNQKVKIWGNFDKSRNELAEDFTNLIKNEGYKVYTEKIERKTVNWSEFTKAILYAVIVILIFIILQKIGILDFLTLGTANYPSIFMLGIVASLSSCMAVVGGLVLSISANYAKEDGKSVKPMIAFHASRLISFFVLGGFLGILGTLFSIVHVTSTILAILLSVLITGLTKIQDFKLKISLGLVVGIISYLFLSNILNEIWAKFALNLVTGLVMVILGLNLLEIFNFTKRFQLRMPKSLSRTALSTENIKNRFTPILLGLATFFLPCGFTQTMQFEALKQGDFMRGAMIMLAFALGTLPVLAAISFASTNLINSTKKAGVFFKTAGLIVLFFAIVNIIGALGVAGMMRPVFGF